MNTVVRTFTPTEETLISTLIAIAYPDEATATAAEAEAQRLADGLILQPDAIAVVCAKKTGIDQAFQKQVRAQLQPGSSALFLVLEHATEGTAVEALSQYGDTVLKSSLSHEDEQALQDALHGDSTRPAP